ncbi:hypothetical protein HBH98_184840 [Parastagonospora nodorum]|nr:hypothetical protein HBI95_143580 [Parastagonospora nodorum]KAH4310341.1 hypothetical protein HBI01_024980 [Parastagonospora nodorum]KAH4315308.1 hypothetical protein HBI02_055280 [Parastagonospora nodorum]KAH4338258.1 hypothetical protein HBI00_001870 [Parastagonospora nodorum]KAH4340912.1 hypothetical protein HBH98_184840 [Parastagonospora nodorum]
MLHIPCFFSVKLDHHVRTLSVWNHHCTSRIVDTVWCQENTIPHLHRVASLIQFGAKKTLYHTSTELHRRQKEMNHFASETGSFDYLNMNCECLSKHV